MSTPITLSEHLLPTNLFVSEAEYEQPEISSELLEMSPDTAPAIGEIACLAIDEAIEPLTLRQRFTRSKLARTALGGLAALGLATGGIIVESSPAFADSDPVYTVVNPDNDGTYSIYDRNSPSWADSNRKAPDFSLYGDRLELICGTNGEAIGPYKNTRWHYAKNLSRPEAGFTWISDRYMNTPNKANQPTPGEKECGTSVPKPEAPAQAKACYFNLKAPSKSLTFSYDGNHRYYGNAWQAAKNWTDAGADINIKPGSNNTYIQFKDINTRGNLIAQAQIPTNTEWMGPYKTVPSNPHIPKVLTILVNRYNMDKLNDFQRTYALTHEIGHTLGLAHPEMCGYADKSIMNAGSDIDGVFQRTFNTPISYDKMELKQLYN